VTQPAAGSESTAASHPPSTTAQRRSVAQFALQSFRLGTLFGVVVRVHSTFILVFGLLWIETWRSEGARAALTTVTQFAVLFCCVLLHELGHSLAARRFGVAVYDILLWPLGGVARIASIPESTRAELTIALAGPLVNFALLCVLGPLLVLRGEWPITIALEGPPPSVFEWAFFVNLGMGTFNLLPAFPMDGGRVLRALLARRLAPLAATSTAVFVGRLFACLALVVGLSDPELLALSVLGAFVWWIGSVELSAAIRRANTVVPGGAP
jgi:Zn-dependent protease